MSKHQVYIKCTLCYKPLKPLNPHLAYWNSTAACNELNIVNAILYNIVERDVRFSCSVQHYRPTIFRQYWLSFERFEQNVLDHVTANWQLGSLPANTGIRKFRGAICYRPLGNSPTRRKRSSSVYVRVHVWIRASNNDLIHFKFATIK